MTTPKRKYVKEVFELDSSDFLGNAQDVLAGLSVIVEELELAGNLNVSFEPYQGGGYGNYFALAIAYERPESDKEYAFRIKAEEQAKNSKQKAEQKKLEKERKEYERLKAKFEAKSNG